MEKEEKIPIRTVLKHHLKGIANKKWLVIFCFASYILSNVISVFIPYLYKNFFDILNQSGNKSFLAQQLLQIIIIIAIFHFCEWLFYRTGFFIMNTVESRVMAKLKQNSFSYLIKHSHNFFTNNFTGSLVQKVNRFARAFERVFDTILFQLLPLFISVIGAVIITSFVSPVISLTILLWVIFYVSFGLIFFRWKMKYDIQMAAVDSETTGLLSDNISNNQPISLFNGTNNETISFEKITKKQADITIKTWNYAGIYDSIQLFIIFVIEFFVFYYAIKYWQADKLTVGGFVMIQVYVVSLGRQIWLVNRVIRDIFESLADSKQMVEVLETPHEIKDVSDAKLLRVNTGKINFKNVTFSFNENRKILNGINCEIKPGEKVAIVGPSGAGKTTFIRLLLRIYNLNQGEILIDGQDIQKVTQESLRYNISLVPQDPVLFHRTLMENIRYGRPDASDAEVIEASKLAHCDDFIDVLPDKYNTFVGERGIKLSGGERQRVAIARAILKKAPILILDEATSGLDSHSETLIQDALDNLMKSCTTIVIAHRLSTIKKMDRIIVMNDGRIVEEGTHDELANKKSGLYKKLWALQAGGFINK